MATPINTITAFILQDLDLSNPIYKSNKLGYVILVKQAWCGHCKNYIATYDKFATDISDYQLLYIEGTENEDILRAWANLVHPNFTINGFPTLLVFDKHGKYHSEIENRMKLDSELKSKTL
jgi:thiol-disulfide isomerase/thioredoxin